MLQIVPNYNTQPISQGDRSNPALLVADGTNGESVVDRLYLHNTESSKYYTGVILRAQGVPEDFTIKILAQKNQPTDEEWSVATDSAEHPDVGNALRSDVDYHPFWIFYQVPKGTPVQTALASIQILFSENMIS